MKAIITVKRVTEYSSIVEMDEATFERLTYELDLGLSERRKAEQDLNRRIDTKDWQDDEFDSLVDFKKFEE